MPAQSKANNNLLINDINRRFQISRKAADTKLRSFQNVVGTCFGLKEKAGVKTSQLSLIVFVKRKIGAKRLARRDLIPDEARRHGKDWPTDVVVLRPPRNELRFGVQDGVQRGTLGCFARTAQDLFGVTCAHCIGGPDHNAFTPNDIAMEFPSSGQLIRMGKSVTAIIQPGTGITPHFGDLDLGLISLEDNTLRSYADTRPALKIFRPPANIVNSKQLSDLLLFTPLTGFGGVSGLRTAIISGVMVSIPPFFFDLMITSADGVSPLTTVGDSGLLWVGPFGRAFGFHMKGDGIGVGNTSVRTFSSFAFRAADNFGITLHAI